VEHFELKPLCKDRIQVEHFELKSLCKDRIHVEHFELKPLCKDRIHVEHFELKPLCKDRIQVEHFELKPLCKDRIHVKHAKIEPLCLSGKLVNTHGMANIQVQVSVNVLKFGNHKRMFVARKMEAPYLVACFVKIQGGSNMTGTICV
jgi:hypothetical protein